MDNKDILSRPVEGRTEENYEKYKQTPFKQYRKVFITYLLTAVALTALGLIAAINFIVSQTGTVGTSQIISSIIMILIQGIVIYATTYDIATHDIKPYSKIKPQKLKGIYLMLPAIAIAVLLTIIYLIVWKVCGKNTIEHGTIYEALKASGAPNFASWFDHNEQVRVMPSAFGVVINFLYMVWIFPYYPIIQPNAGLVHIVGLLLSIALPVAFGQIGYVFGMKKIDLTLFWNKLIYDKNKE